MNKSLLLIALLILAFASCTKKEDKKKFSDTPNLEFINVSDTSISYNDTGKWVCRLRFTDGDGNIGTDPTEAEMLIQIRDSRKDQAYPYPFPFIPGSDRNHKYLEGMLDIVLSKKAFFLPRYDSAHMTHDTFHYEIYMLDTDSNVSNLIITPTLYVHP